MKVTRRRTTLQGLHTGRLCWFLDPRTGEIIEGFYTGERTVERTIHMTGETGSRRFDVQTFTVPADVHIAFGLAPLGV